MSTITLTVSEEVAMLFREHPDLLKEASQAVESLYAVADEATIAGVARGLADFNAGQSLSLDEAFEGARTEIVRRMAQRRQGSED